MNKETYLIAMETKSATYLGKGVFLVDLFIMAVYWFVLDFFQPLIHPDLQLVFSIWNVFLAFLMTRKSRKNPQKRILQSLLYALWARNHTVYHVHERKEPEINYVEPAR